MNNPEPNFEPILLPSVRFWLKVGLASPVGMIIGLVWEEIMHGSFPEFYILAVGATGSMIGVLTINFMIHPPVRLQRSPKYVILIIGILGLFVMDSAILTVATGYRFLDYLLYIPYLFVIGLLVAFLDESITKAIFDTSEPFSGALVSWLPLLIVFFTIIGIRSIFKNQHVADWLLGAMIGSIIILGPIFSGIPSWFR